MTFTAEPWADQLTERITDLLPGHAFQFATYLRQPFVIASFLSVPPLLEALKLRLHYDYLVDITAVDYPARPERFDLVYVLYSYSTNHRLRVKTAVSDTARPASATSLYRAANWLEREVYDMFGIEFEGHPNMKRILMPDEWTGFPLRKDYPILLQDQDWVQKNLGIESGQ